MRWRGDGAAGALRLVGLAVLSLDMLRYKMQPSTVSIPPCISLLFADLRSHGFFKLFRNKSIDLSLMSAASGFNVWKNQSFGITPNKLTTPSCSWVLYGMSYDLPYMEQGELRHDQHAVLAQTNRMRKRDVQAPYSSAGFGDSNC